MQLLSTPLPLRSCPLRSPLLLVPARRSCGAKRSGGGGEERGSRGRRSWRGLSVKPTPSLKVSLVVVPASQLPHLHADSFSFLPLPITRNWPKMPTSAQRPTILGDTLEAPVLNPIRARERRLLRRTPIPHITTITTRNNPHPSLF